VSHEKKVTDDLQGEGDYAAAEQYGSSVRDFVKRGKVQKHAREAAPENSREEAELAQAEEVGRSHARGAVNENGGESTLERRAEE